MGDFMEEKQKALIRMNTEKVAKIAEDTGIPLETLYEWRREERKLEKTAVELIKTYKETGKGIEQFEELEKSCLSNFVIQSQVIAIYAQSGTKAGKETAKKIAMRFPESETITANEHVYTEWNGRRYQKSKRNGRAISFVSTSTISIDGNVCEKWDRRRQQKGKGNCKAIS